MRHYMLPAPESRLQTKSKLLALPTPHIPLLLHSGQCGRAVPLQKYYYITALDRYYISQKLKPWGGLTPHPGVDHKKEKLKPRYEAETMMHALLSFGRTLTFMPELSC